VWRALLLTIAPGTIVPTPDLAHLVDKAAEEATV
jgi:hypothetical protein